SHIIPAIKKIVISFCDKKIDQSDFSVSSDTEFLFLKTDADLNEIHAVLENLCRIYQGDNVRLVIDYTYMHKRILGAIVSFLTLNEFTCERLTVYFCCSELPVSELEQSSAEAVLQPILLYENYKHNQRPIALIVELNSLYLVGQVKELFYSFCPDKIFFYVSSHLEKRATRMALEHFPKSKIYEYNPRDMEKLDEDLRQLCRNLRLENRVVIVSMGSKIFSMVSFLINARYPDVEVWQYGYPGYIDTKELCEGNKYVFRAVLSDDFLEDIN
ncbi:MAG: hypothetical protein N2662_01220, partial [Bacteroidales bacterium]|nr:hypothetical protein [Bacteroidales bacterium]